MRLRHSHDRYYDLTAQLEQLSRDTTEMLLETLGSIPIVGNGIFNDMQYMTELDWDDKDLDAFLVTCVCGIIVSVLALIYMIWRIIALFMAYT